MSGNKSPDSSQSSPSLLSSLERFKSSPKITLTDYFTKKSTSPSSSPSVGSPCNGIENKIPEKKHCENSEKEKAPEIVNGHNKEKHKDSYDKDSPGNKHKDSPVKTSSSNKNQESPGKLNSNDKQKESHKSSSDKGKEPSKSALDKLKEFRKSSSDKHKDSHRSSSEKHKESSKSSSDKHRESPKGSFEKLKQFRKNPSDKHKDSDKTKSPSKKHSTSESGKKYEDSPSKSSSSKKHVSTTPEKANSSSKHGESDKKNSSSKTNKHESTKQPSASSSKKVETISDSDSNSSANVKFKGNDKHVTNSVKKETISDSDSSPIKVSELRKKDLFISPVKKAIFTDSDNGTEGKSKCPEKENVSDSDGSIVEAPVKKRRKVVIADDSEEEEAEKSSENPKKRCRVAVESISDSDGEADGPSKENSKKIEKHVQKKKRVERNSESEVESGSDVDYAPEYSGSKGKIVSFLSSSPVNDLKQVISMTQKKIDVIVAKRPFSSWFELVNQLRANSVNIGLLDNVAELLKAREVFSKLMKKVAGISEATQSTIKSREGKMKKQPLLLSPELQLSDYQLIGVNWLAVLHSLKMGGILADEMGLGKTVQVISFLAHLKEKKLVHHPHLIVVPSSTLVNWENELRRWCPSLGFQLYHGSVEERRETRYAWNKEGFGNTEVVLTTYNVVSNNFEDVKMTRTQQFHYVIFDEAHMLKNMKTQRYSRLFQIRAKHRLLLTGTPLQNNLLELLSLLHFTMPEVFTKNLESIKYLFGKQTKPINNDSPDFEKEKVEQVKKLMEPFVLRRLKCNVLKDLPRKDVSVIKCPMIPDQESKYKELLTEFKETESFENLYMTMFTSLKKMANHPLLLRYHYDEAIIGEMAECLALDPDYKDTNVQYIVQDLIFMSDFELHQLSDNFKCLRYERFKLPESLFLISGKFKKLDELLPTLKKDGHRVLIFSQFLMILDLLERYLSASGYSFRRLDGSTPVPERQELIDEYNKDPSIFCFLLSTRAGGLGINLTAADTVIIHDIDINPYNDKQAEDRCHRVGQKRPVTVYKFISENTLEEELYQVTQLKLNLEHEVTKEGDEAAEKETLAALLRRALGLTKDNAIGPKS